ncbi:MAG: arsenate reductase ArsC [Rhodospirillaceae bacterium]
MHVLPSAILFCCNLNQVRSPMAEGIMKRFHGSRVFVDSAGVSEGVSDPFMVEVMREIGVDMSRHRPKTLTDIEPDSFELMIALSPEARQRAEGLIRYMHCDLRAWDIPDPTRVEGTRAARLSAYRQVRDQLQQKILELFPREDH